MDDIEKVVKEFDDVRRYVDDEIHPLVSPDNWEIYSALCDMIDSLKSDVITTLKAQMPVEPTFDFDGDMVCGNCGCPLDKKYGECPKCGRKVEWDD